MKTKIAQNLAIILTALSIIAEAPQATGQIVNVSVPGAANIFGAGHAIPPGGGSLPPLVELPAASGRFIKFLSVTGFVTSDGFPFPPDGRPDFTPTDVNSTPTVSGIVADRTLFLTGVFLEANEPATPSPDRLDFSTNGFGRAFTLLLPAVAQTFYIGDGRAGTNSGAFQLFRVPATATRLFLGIVDAWDGSAVRGDPGAYFDDAGSYEVQLEVITDLQPQLTISRLTNAVAISWPAAATGYCLESTQSLPTLDWSLVTNTAVATTERITVVFDVADTTRFFRLRKD